MTKFQIYKLKKQKDRYEMLYQHGHLQRDCLKNTG